MIFSNMILKRSAIRVARNQNPGVVFSEFDHAAHFVNPLIPGIGILLVNIVLYIFGRGKKVILGLAVAFGGSATLDHFSFFSVLFSDLFDQCK